MKLGLSGALTRAFIKSPLTPLLLLAALAAGAIALVSLPREEEPQISVPMVDIMVTTNGYKAADAVELVTRPLEDIVKGIDGVEHVYSQTQDDSVLVTARFLVGTDQDTAILRVHEKIRANIINLPKGIPEPVIIGRGINDVAIVDLTLSADPAHAGRWSDNGLFQVGEELQHELAQGRQRRRRLYRRREPEPDQGRTRSGAPRALWNHAEPAHRQADQRQPVVRRRRAARERPLPARRGGPDAARRAGHRPAVADLARRSPGLRQGRRQRRRRRRRARTSRLDDDAARGRRFAAPAGAHHRHRQAQGRQRGLGRRRRAAPSGDRQRADRAAGDRRRGDAQLRRDRDRKGQRAAVPPRPGDAIDRRAHHLRHRLARRRGGSHHHSHHDPADAVRVLADGLHHQSGQPVRADLLDRHSRRRRDRRGREHRPALVEARGTRPRRDRGRGRRRSRQPDDHRDADDRRRAAADDVRERHDGPLHEPHSGQRLDRHAVFLRRRGHGDALAAVALGGSAPRSGPPKAPIIPTTSARSAGSTRLWRARCCKGAGARKSSW